MHALREFGSLEFFEWKTREHPSWQRYGHSPQHCTLRELRELGITCNASTQAFAVVRRPVERVVSEFNRLTHLGWISKDLGIDDFLDEFLDSSEAALKRWDAHQLSCAEYLRDADGHVSQDVHIMHYDAEHLLERVAVYLFPKDAESQQRFASIGARGGGSKLLSVEDLSEEQVARINTFFQEDLDLFSLTT